MSSQNYDFDFDLQALAKTLDGIHKKVLPDAVAGFLNGIAFAGRRNLLQHNQDAFDGHVSYTDRGWYVTKTKASSREEAMQTRVEALPDQADYLKYQIFGGTRGKGDAGSGPYDLLLWAPRRNSAGNIERGYLRRYRLTQRNKREKEQRAAHRAKRTAHRAAQADYRMQMDSALSEYKKASNRRDAADWIVAEPAYLKERVNALRMELKSLKGAVNRLAARERRAQIQSEIKRISLERARLRKQATAARQASRVAGRDMSTIERSSRRNKAPKPMPTFESTQRGKGGIFFAEINGWKGYWERPTRSEAFLPRQKGLRQVTPEGTLRPLALFGDEADYRPKYDYDGQIQKAVVSHGTRAMFDAEMQRAINKHMQKGG